MRITRSIFCLVGILTMACGGGGDGKCSPTDPTCGPPPPPPPAFSYTMTNSGNVSVQKSNTASVTAQATISKTLTAGSTQGVSLVVSGLPNGVTSTLVNGDCSPTCQATVNFTVESSAAVGSHPVTVTGSPNGVTTSFTLTVTAAPVVVRTLDTLKVAASAPGVTFTATWATGTASVQITSDNDHNLVVATGLGTLPELRVNGGTLYEDRLWTNLPSGNGKRYSAVLDPKCQADQPACTTREQRLKHPGASDPLPFNPKWNDQVVSSPFSVREDLLLSMKVMLVDGVGLGWSADDELFIASQIAKSNEGDSGRVILTLAGHVNDTIPALGVIKVWKNVDNAGGNGGAPRLFSGSGIGAGIVRMARDGLRDEGNFIHELRGHAMGAGHTCEWVSNMRSALCSGQRPAERWFTAKDYWSFWLNDMLRKEAIRINANLSYFDCVGSPLGCVVQP